MIVITPAALAASGYKPCALGKLLEQDADESFVFLFPSPDPINQANGDGELHEIHDYGQDCSFIDTAAGTIRELGGKPIGPETTVYFRGVYAKARPDNGPKDLAPAQEEALGSGAACVATCARCDGCGQIADSDDGEPWSAWTSLPPKSQVAIEVGLVRPIECPDCGGTGRRPAADVRQDAEIASTVAAVEAGNLAEGITIPRSEPRRLSDEELGGRAALEAAGLEPVDGWDEERASKAEPARLKVYQVQFDGEQYYAEAASFGEAVDLWRRHVAELWGDDYQETDEPESVVLLGDGPVLRSAVDWGLLDLLVELKRAAHDAPQILPAIEALQRRLQKAVGPSCDASHPDHDPDGRRIAPAPCDRFAAYEPAPGYCKCGWIKSAHRKAVRS